MRLITVFAAVLAPAVVMAQTLGRPQAPTHATVSASASAGSVSPGHAITLWADVTPKPGIHIYAEGAKEFTPVSLTILSHDDISTGATRYPPAERPLSLKSTVDAPAYYGKFRIIQPIMVGENSAAPRTITVNGQVNYQACDDHLCYPVTSAPVSWTIAIK